MADAVGRVPRHAATASPIRLARPLAKRVSAGARLRAELHLQAGERVLIRVRRPRGTGVVATDRALYWQPPPGGWARLGWEQISRVERDRSDGGVVVIGLATDVAQRTVLPIQNHRRFLALAHERIAATRVIVTRLAIDGRELMVEGRRQPASGRLHWFVSLVDGVDLQDPGLPAKLDQALADLRSALGI